jgi:uncharacterized protein (DUF2126 family)
MLDGRHTGTGGGNHVTLGGPTAGRQPLLRAPTCCASLVSYWQDASVALVPLLGMFVGPRARARAWTRRAATRSTSSRSRSSSSRRSSRKGEPNERPWLVDRILRNFLVDLTGNTHRAEFSIDKLYAPGSATGRLGLLEFRAFEMPPHARMSLAQILPAARARRPLLETPYTERLVHWDTRLHDEFMLPHFVARTCATWSRT